MILVKLTCILKGDKRMQENNAIQKAKTWVLEVSEWLASTAFSAWDELKVFAGVSPWLKLTFRGSFTASERNKSTTKPGCMQSSVGDESMLKTSVKHSLTTSRPSRSTPGAGSTKTHGGKKKHQI